MNALTAEVTGSPVRSNAGLRRLLFGLAAALSFAAIVLAVGLQRAYGLDPCPLCILQRYALLALGLFSALAALRPTHPVSAVLGLAALLSAAAGTALAAHQVWMVNNPAISSCSYRLFRMVNEAWPAQWLPALFAGGGDCLAADWTLAGYTVPHLSLLLLTVLTLVSWLGFVVPRR
jgi:disulfide bond formation protein DsbB